MFKTDSVRPYIIFLKLFKRYKKESNKFGTNVSTSVHCNVFCNNPWKTQFCLWQYLFGVLEQNSRFLFTCGFCNPIIAMRTSNKGFFRSFVFLCENQHLFLLSINKPKMQYLFFPKCIRFYLLTWSTKVDIPIWNMQQVSLFHISFLWRSKVFVLRNSNKFPHLLKIWLTFVSIFKHNNKNILELTLKLLGIICHIFKPFDIVMKFF